MDQDETHDPSFDVHPLLRPQYMTPDQIADLVRRAKENAQRTAVAAAIDKAAFWARRRAQREATALEQARAQRRTA